MEPSDDTLCLLSGKPVPIKDQVKAGALRPGFYAYIKSEKPECEPESILSRSALSDYRRKYLESIVEQERTEISKVEKQVLEAIERQELAAPSAGSIMQDMLPLGDRVADRVAAFGGSWIFILTFISILLAWIVLNILLKAKAFDPYPYILLNLILSCVAALQAPIIMMSQNRQENKDRQRNEYDYKVNLKAELEIRLLHEKLDHLLVYQSQQLLDLQQIQIDLPEDILALSS